MRRPAVYEWLAQHLRVGGVEGQAAVCNTVQTKCGRYTMSQREPVGMCGSVGSYLQARHKPFEYALARRLGELVESVWRISRTKVRGRLVPTARLGRTGRHIEIEPTAMQLVGLSRDPSARSQFESAVGVGTVASSGGRFSGVGLSRGWSVSASTPAACMGKDCKTAGLKLLLVGLAAWARSGAGSVSACSSASGS
jgi:hypothetical protein